MSILVIMIIVWAGMVAVAIAHGSGTEIERGNPMFELGTLLGKAIGSTLGSGIAVIFRPGGDKAHKLLSRFFIGAILGVIFAPVFIDYMGWEHQFDYWLAAGCATGLTGYLTLEILYSQEFWMFIKNRLNRGKSN